MAPKDKMQRAAQCLNRRLGVDWERAELEKGPKFPRCRVRLDRLVVTTGGFHADVRSAIPQFICRKKHFLRRARPEDVLPYARLTEFVSETSIEQMFVLTEPQLLRVKPCKITMIAKDTTGLNAKDVLSVLNTLPDVRVVTLELAFDFRRASGIDGSYVRRHAVFGKARQRGVGLWFGYDNWGCRTGRKLIRSYYKTQIRAHRLELQLNGPFQERHGIVGLFDFWRLAKTVPIKQILFAQLNELKVIAWLRNNGCSAAEVLRVMQRVYGFEENLLAQCRVLRRKGGIKNVNRFLVPLATNELVKESLRTWIKRWQQTFPEGKKNASKVMDR